MVSASARLSALACGALLLPLAGLVTKPSSLSRISRKLGPLGAAFGGGYAHRRGFRWYSLAPLCELPAIVLTIERSFNSVVFIVSAETTVRKPVEYRRPAEKLEIFPRALLFAAARPGRGLPTTLCDIIHLDVCDGNKKTQFSRSCGRESD